MKYILTCYINIEELKRKVLWENRLNSIIQISSNHKISEFIDVNEKKGISNITLNIITLHWFYNDGVLDVQRLIVFILNPNLALELNIS